MAAREAGGSGGADFAARGKRDRTRCAGAVDRQQGGRRASLDGLDSLRTFRVDHSGSRAAMQAFRHRGAIVVANRPGQDSAPAMPRRHN